jgi:tellurite methyltransferase
VEEPLTADEQTIWNAKYAEGSHASLTPDPFLVEAYENYVSPLRKGETGHALDLAGGVGRHAIWLAKRGWKVTLTDISDQAIAIATRNAESAGVELDLRIANARDFFAQSESSLFDLILVFFFLERDIFPVLVQHLKPGGVLFYKTYTAEQPKLRPGQGPTHSMHLLERNELLNVFSNLEILFYRETTKDRGIAELVARKKPV